VGSGGKIVRSKLVEISQNGPPRHLGSYSAATRQKIMVRIGSVNFGLARFGSERSGNGLEALMVRIGQGRSGSGGWNLDQSGVLSQEIWTNLDPARRSKGVKMV